MSEIIGEVLEWLGAMSEVLFLLIGLLLGYLSQFLLDRSTEKRRASAQLRQERQQAHINFHMEVNRFFREIKWAAESGVGERATHDQSSLDKSRSLLDLLPAIEFLAEPRTYLTAAHVAETCMAYERTSALKDQENLVSASKVYLKAVRHELGLKEPLPGWAPHDEPSKR